MGLERRKASLGSRLKANASGAINFTLSRTYLLRSLLLSLPLLFSAFLFVSFSSFHSLLLSIFSCNLIVSINFVVSAATRRQTVVHFAAGVAPVNSSLTPPSYRSPWPQAVCNTNFSLLQLSTPCRKQTQILAPLHASFFSVSATLRFALRGE